ncbi:MAG: histidinol-phosphate transaminase [Xanthomonadales bacterium]|jgi:histidinol-phosphate aminotransferase|nr:histidinol-phosphate transaminase [Xanthomonadales bacterium]
MSVTPRELLGPGCDPTDWAVDGVRGLKPYQPGKPISELEREYGVRDAVKLASNENPLGVSPAALAAMRDELEDLWLYPDGGGFSLRSRIAAFHGVSADCVTLGNGSNDTLVLLAQTFLAPGREAVFSQYAFAVYPIATQAAGARARVVPALGPGSDQPLGHDLEALAAAVSEDTRIVFIANPNNPTGTWVEGTALRRFLDRVPRDVIVVVDEAYTEYARPLGAPDASEWLADYDNLVVSRTFSKAYGLAGIRVGYMLSSPAIAGLLNRIRQPFNVNQLAMVGAEAALGDVEFIERSVRENAAGLRQLKSGLRSLGLDVPPSAGNFVLVDLGRDAAPVNEALLRAGVIVRPVANYGLSQHLRITVGTEAQNERLLMALGPALNATANA